MRRRYRRSKLRWKPILTLLLLVNVLAAGFVSRITSVRVVEVLGVIPEDAGRIRVVLETLRGIPFSKVREKEIETEVLREPAIRSAVLTHSILGQAQLVVQYRAPIARLGDNTAMGLDAEGVVFDLPSISAELPVIRLAGGGPETLVTVAGDWDAMHLAELAVKVRAMPEADGVSIDVDERGEVCLNMNSGRVVLGSCDDLDEKLKVLQKRLLANPVELSQVERLILTKPDAPAIVPLSKNPTRAHRSG